MSQSTRGGRVHECEPGFLHREGNQHARLGESTSFPWEFHSLYLSFPQASLPCLNLICLRGMLHPPASSQVVDVQVGRLFVKKESETSKVLVDFLIPSLLSSSPV